jgi:hypothetical protein
MPQITAAMLQTTPAWKTIKASAEALQPRQIHDGSIPNQDFHFEAKAHVINIAAALLDLVSVLPNDADYLTACAEDFTTWAEQGFHVPDFYSALSKFRPEQHRIDGLPHVVVFPMYTQNGSTDRLVEAVLLEVIFPEFVAELEAAHYPNKAFVPVRFIDFTPGYNTNSAVIFPESVAVTPRVPAGSPEGAAPSLPDFTWGGIFADREAARFRKVVKAAVDITKLELPVAAQDLLNDQDLAEKTFVMWDLIHDQTHMRGDLPFDPFMIKQRMPFFLYGLEELRCDLVAFRECVKISLDEKADPTARKHAALVQYAVLFDRIFRFPLTGNRTRNYDGVAGQLLFAWLHQKRVLHWTDTALTIDWADLPAAVIELSDAINDLYWRSIDRPKIVHWLEAYKLVAGTLAPHPASFWAKGDLPLTGKLSGLTDLVLDDEFPLSMFYEALAKKMQPTMLSVVGITGRAQNI